ncbi:MAG: SusC/RagA family TonB-linked outer membrane protein [Bacteroidales bacterium]|nr:SusC/RagA family TonB-linked outer membrane protein [Bacteroidales bacterium]
MKRILNFLVLPAALILCLGFSATAQRTITGTVISADDNLGIPGASIIVRGSSPLIGTVTDINGRFSITMSAEHTHLVFSFTGMETQEIDIAGRTTVNVTMRTDAIGLGEVVVIGFGTATRERLTGAVTTIGEADFRQGVFSSPASLLVGTAAGVHVSPSTGRAGDGNRIRIRGGSSLNASNDPLIVIDGLPVSNSGIGGQTDPLSSLNPNDIYNITILRDASATAIFGSRASNGVIIITTKSGRGVQPGQINVEVSTVNSIATVARQVDVLSASQFRNLVETFPGVTQVQLDRLGYWVDGEQRFANTCWQSEIYRRAAFTTDNNVAISGAFTRNFPYRVSIGNFHQNGVLRTDHINRTTAAVSLRPSFFRNHLNINANVRGSHQQSRFGDGGAIGAAIRMDPTKPVRAADMERYNGFWQWESPTGPTPPGTIRNINTMATSNPLSVLESRQDLGTGNRLFGNIQATYRLHSIEGLSASANFGFDLVNGFGTNTWAPWAPGFLGVGRHQQHDQTRTDLLFDAHLNYARNFGRHSIDIMTGYSYHSLQTEHQNFPYLEYDRETVVGAMPTFPTRLYESVLISFFGRMQYSFDDRYMFQFSLRTDGSSRFAPDNRWGVFPAASVAWRLDREQFLVNNPFVTSLRLRAGWGVTGQQDGIGLYDHIPRYGLSTGTAMVRMGYNEDGTPRWVQMWRPTAFDGTRGWEETAQWNVGVDWAFLGGRISGTIDAYHSTTTNLLNDVNLPIGSNFTNRMVRNIGSMQNQGIEIALNYIPIQTNDLMLELGLNFTVSRREITQLTLNDDDDDIGILIGGISGGVGQHIQMHNVGFAPNTFFVFRQQFAGPFPIEVPATYMQANREMFGNPEPVAFLGFNARVSWRNWQFSTMLRSNIGNYIFNNINADIANYSQVLNGGGFLQNTTQNILRSGFRNRQLVSDFYLESAAFLRMDNISATYNFGSVVGNRGNLSANFTVQNVFTITGYSGVDPERTANNGIDNNAFPFPRTFNLGLRLTF